MTCHSTIVRGLLRSRRIIQDISKIPCDIVNTLENDVDAAKNFVTQLGQGQVPELIKDLPQEIIGTFHDLLNIAASLPTEIFDAAQSAVTDVVHVFDDIENGSIVADLERVPGVVVSDVTAGWGDFTHGVVGLVDEVTSEIGCVFGNCPASATTPPGGGSCAIATTSASHNTQTYTPAKATHSIQETTTSAGNTGSSSTSTTAKPTGSSAAPAQSNLAGGSNGFHSAAIWAMAILGAFGFFICWL